MGKDRFRPGGPRDRGPTFVKLDHWILRTAAWQDLDPVARALYIELRQRFNGFNNGSIGLGTREAGEALNVSKDTAGRAFQSLEEHGFIIVTKKSGFHQKRLAREWLLTSERDDRNGAMASKDFLYWQAAPEKKPVASRGHIGASRGRSLPATTPGSTSCQ